MRFNVSPLLQGLRSPELALQDCKTLPTEGVPSTLVDPIIALRLLPRNWNSANLERQIPLTEWMESSHHATFQHASPRPRSSRSLSDQPTTRRENRSRITARYNQPSRVHR